MTVSGTGHRPNKLGNEYDYKGPITRYIIQEIENYFAIHKVTDVNSGLALGFDQILALVAIKKHIKVHAFIPFKGQDRMWPNRSKELYDRILKRCASIYVVDVDKHVMYEDFLELKPTAYSAVKMQKRNEVMTDEGEEILSCYDGSQGGTDNCIKYALSIGKNIVNIDPTKAKLKNI